MQNGERQVDKRLGLFRCVNNQLNTRLQKKKKKSLKDMEGWREKNGAGNGGMKMQIMV